MENEQEAHVEKIIQDEAKATSIKYRIGQAEHGGNLWKKSGIVKNIRDEKTDLVIYVNTMEEQLTHVQSLLVSENYIEALKWVNAMLSDKTDELVN